MDRSLYLEFREYCVPAEWSGIVLQGEQTSLPREQSRVTNSPSQVRTNIGRFSKLKIIHMKSFMFYESDILSVSGTVLRQTINKLVLRILF